MKTFKKITALMMVFIMGISCFVCGNAIKAQAASTQFTISVSSSSISKGDSVTVSVTISCSEALGAYSYCLSYDSSVLEYASGDGYGGGGTISCAGYGDGNITSTSNSFTFTAIAAGSAYVGTGSSDVYTWGEESCSISNAGTTINVAAAGSSEPEPTTSAPATTQDNTSSETQDTTESSETTATSEDTTEETTEEMSDNCFLSSLQITPGELKPEFSKEVYTYETTVSGETTSLAINALPEDEKSSVTIEGNEDFEPGKTAHVTIKVTAETGDSHIYDILVNVEEIVDTRAVININGTDYYFTQDYSKVNVPEGFAQSKEKYGDTEVLLYTSPNGLLKCAYLTDKEGKNGAWYIIDLEKNTAVPLINVLSAYKNFIILEPDDSVVKPEGYNPFKYDFGGNEVTAYRISESDDIILVYAMNPDSEPGWHRYDTVEKTFVRYIADQTSVVPAESTGEESFFDQHKDTILTICIVVVIIMFILIIVLACVLARVIKKGLPDEDASTEDEFDDVDNLDDTNDAGNLDGADDAVVLNDADNAHVLNDTDETKQNSATEPEVSTDETKTALVGEAIPDTAAKSEAAFANEAEQAVTEPEVSADESKTTLTNENEQNSATRPEVSMAETVFADEAKQPAKKSESESAFADATKQTATKSKVSAEEVDKTNHAADIHDGMTELKADAAATADAPEKASAKAPELASKAANETPDIVKKAAQYSSLNTADLSEVFHMAEAIVHKEENSSQTNKSASLQFKPIKQNKPEDE